MVRDESNRNRPGLVDSDHPGTQLAASAAGTISDDGPTIKSRRRVHPGEESVDFDTPGFFVVGVPDDSNTVLATISSRSGQSSLGGRYLELREFQ